MSKVNEHSKVEVSNFYFTEVLKNVSWDWSKIVMNIHMRDTRKVEYSSNKFTWSEVPYFLNCQIINLNDHFNLTGTAPKILWFMIGPLDNLQVTIQMIEKNKISIRPIQSKFLSYRGPAISKRLKANKVRLFTTINKIEQTIKSEKDKDQPCQNYPTEAYTSFGACDKDYVRKSLSEKLNFMPFWAAETFDYVSKHGIRVNLNPYNVMDLADGLQESSCAQPCLDSKVLIIYIFIQFAGPVYLFQVFATNVFDRDHVGNISRFGMIFDQTVTVTEYFYPNFSLTQFFSSMGGALGLWLGVGVLQMGDFSLKMIKFFKKFFFKPRYFYPKQKE